ncbi:MAG: hypothetical protein QM778_07315 [Myxococcales bacterium]
MRFSGNSTAFAGLLLTVFVAACGSDGPGSGSHRADGGGDQTEGPTDGDAGLGELDSDGGLAGDWLAPSPTLSVPGAAPALASTLLTASTFDGAYQATLDILAAGGVATKFGDDVRRAAQEPASSSFVFPVSAMNLTLEAQARVTTATFSLTEFARMMDELGWPTPENTPPQEHWRDFLAAWYQAAAEQPDAPDSFAVLLMAELNQRQSPPANLASGTEDPNLIRLSGLEIELLIGAFDRTRRGAPKAKSRAAGSAIPKAGGSPCSDFVDQAGGLGQAGQVGAGEGVGQAIEGGLKKLFGDGAAAGLSNGLNALGTLAKIAKLIQEFRYGYVKLELETAKQVQKPLFDTPNTPGKLKATAGVDPMQYADKVAAAGGAENSDQMQAISDCLESLNLPTPTDARDVASDVENWRVSWSIVSGGGSQVLWSEGEEWDIASRFENKLTRVDDSTAINEVDFDILPQKTKATVGKRRMRKAVFKVQLKRGSMPDANTLWGSGKAGAAAAMANPIGAALGIADAIADISTKWALEGASPSAYVQQDLIEIMPTGLVGFVRWTLDGKANRDEGNVENYENHIVERGTLHQDGYVEIVSTRAGYTKAYGNEHCAQSYEWGQEAYAVVEGGEVVGKRVDREVRKFDARWQGEPDDSSVAAVQDGRAACEDIPCSQLPASMKDTYSKVSISLPSALCGDYETNEQFASLTNDYYSSAWHELPDYSSHTETVYPSPLNVNLQLQANHGEDFLRGSDTQMIGTYQLEGLSVPIVRRVEWDLRWLE